MDRVSYYSFVIIAMVLSLPIISHFLRRSPRLLKWSNYIILAVYLFANLYLTLFSRGIDTHNQVRLTPFWSYVKMLDSPRLREEIILNIYLYIPFGYLMHYAFPKLKWRTVFFCGVALSCLTELTQLVLGLGWCEVDDVISNSLGTLIGIGMYKGYKILVRQSIEKTD